MCMCTSLYLTVNRLPLSPPPHKTTVKLEGRSGQYCLEVLGDALFTDAACGGKRVTEVSACVCMYVLGGFFNN